jgi:hypothetical protein
MPKIHEVVVCVTRRCVSIAPVVPIGRRVANCRWESNREAVGLINSIARMSPIVAGYLTDIN